MKSIILSSLSFVIVVLIFLLLAVSLDVKLHDLITFNFDFKLLFTDLAYSFIRVTLAAIVASLLSIIAGKLIQLSRLLSLLLIPPVNFIRHISPYAWLPFALIWFGLGEMPAFFILFIALFFPAVIMMIDIFSSLPIEYKEEAEILGADKFQIFLMIEIPLLKAKFINLFRVLWGLGFTTVIAVEMLGVEMGMGFRLLDLRYLLKYKEMIIYLFAMGITGILIDHLLMRYSNQNNIQ